MILSKVFHDSKVTRHDSGKKDEMIVFIECLLKRLLYSEIDCILVVQYSRCNTYPSLYFCCVIIPIVTQLEPGE